MAILQLKTDLHRRHYSNHSLPAVLLDIGDRTMLNICPRFMSFSMAIALFASSSLIAACTTYDSAVDSESEANKTTPDGENVAVSQEALAGVLEASCENGQLQLMGAFTGYGKGDVDCGPGMVALGGGARCTDGDFDVSYPKIQTLNGNNIPVGWAEWHRGSSSNDCWVHAVCVPAQWFTAGQINVVSASTGYGKGSVYCPSTSVAVGGGSFCTDGDFDVAYPNVNLSGWNEWHRGQSSGDCKAYAVCVSKTNWVANNVYRVSASTGYGKGSVLCPGDYAVSGGSYCTDGGSDWDYPRNDLAGWEEWHRGSSSGDCSVFGVCLKSTAVP